MDLFIKRKHRKTQWPGIFTLLIVVTVLSLSFSDKTVSSARQKQLLQNSSGTVSATEQKIRATTLYQPTWSPDSRFLTFDAKINDKWTILKIGADGSGLQTLTEPAHNNRLSAWSPDGKRIAFLSDRGGQSDIFSMDTNGANVRQITNDAAREWSPRWSPDGRLIAFLSDRDGRKEIYVIRPDGTAPFRVTREVADIEGRLCWAPDGKVAFYATPPGKRTADENPVLLWLVRPDGSGLTTVTKQPRREWNPTWSPDGRQMAFDAHQHGQWESEDGGWEIWAQNADSTNRRQLTRNSVNDWGPAWSPDGKHIAYCSGLNDKYEIWVMNANGADARRLTHLVYEGNAPGEPVSPARQVLKQALQTLGGQERLQAVTSLTIKAKGVENRAAELQGHRPGAPTNTSHEETLAIFPAAGKLALEHRTGRHDGSVRHRRWLYAGNDRTVADFITQSIYPRRNVSTETERLRMSRRVPHLLLLEAARHPESLELLDPAASYEGIKHQVLAWTPPNEKATFRLFFDARTHLLSKSEYTMDYSARGDPVIEYTYSDWRIHERLGRFPARQAIKICGQTFRRVDNMEVNVNAPQAEDLFRLPDLNRPNPVEPFRLPESFNVAEAETGKLTTAAPGVYVTMVGSFTVM